MFASCRQQSPVIHSIDPKIGQMGEVLTIRGENFGKERDVSFVTIAGTAPTSSAYLDWQDDRISFRVPEFGDGGLIYIYVKGKKSNAALFVNQAIMPQPVRDSGPGLSPKIISLSSQTGSIGSLITITGSNFGNSRERGGVFFSWDAELSASTPAEAKMPDFIEASATEFGYELWNEREIRVRVPDGAISGNLEVRTLRGNSAPFFFDITGRPGTKTFWDKRSYTISYSVNVKVNNAQSSNTLYLWIPQPAVSSAQRNSDLLFRNIEPFVNNYRGTSLYKLDNLTKDSETQINLSYKIDVYAMETRIQPASIRQEEAASVMSVYTQSDLLLPCDDPLIKTQVNAILGRERNPYIKAQRIYEWMNSANIIQDTVIEGGVLEALEAKRADPYTGALLYCTLLRAAGVPCIPVAGVLVNRNRQTLRHYWTEFWISGFGWIPVDPALGAGAIPPAFNTRPDRASFYFGSLDSQRIAFSRGIVGLAPMAPRGRPISHSRSYSLQSLWEEASGIDSYSSLWGDITVTGMYAQ
jgi:transglutaminase-like putative cysteine protease